MLCDNANKDVIIKRDGRKNYEFEFGKEEWKRVGILDYFSEDSDKYEKYVSISAEEAAKQLELQREKLTEICELVCSCKEYNICIDSANDSICDIEDNLEQKIVSMIFKMGKSFYDSIKDSILLERINNSLDCLFNYISISDEKGLIELRTHRNTRLVAVDFFSKMNCDENSNITRNEVIVDFLEQRIITLDENQKKIVLNK